MKHPGVVVVMASHNSARFIERALASIDASLAGKRPYALVIADDASTDQTLRIARQFPMRAEERIIVGFPKAPGISESKNRAVKLARTLTDRFPWVAFMDDDDEMLGPRFSVLLDRMEAEGQKAGTGDWIIFPEGGHPGMKHGDWSLRTGNYGPGQTIIHRDLLPRDGDYFAPVPRDVFDDSVTHYRMALSGVPWCYHGGEPIHVYHHRGDSFTRGPEHSKVMRRKTDDFLSSLPPTRTSIRSIATVAFGPSVHEAELMVRSLRITGNHQPVVVLTNTDGASVVQGWGLENVEPMLVDTAALEAQFVDAPPIYNFSSLNLGAFLGKMQVLSEAVRRHGSALYLDADMLVLRLLTDVIDAPVGLTPERARSCHDGRPSSWNNERPGYFNGGCVYASRDGLAAIEAWRRDYLRNWRRFGSDDGPHGCFCDQSSLEVLPLLGETHVFHPGHNLMYTRVPRDVPDFSATLTSPEEVLARTKISVRHGLYFRGWPVVTMHAHFRTANWATDASKAFRRILGFSELAEHREIASLIDGGSS